ncbi:MAG: OsmC family protein [Pseudomonadota bacterium]|nr:peroxiredoxin [Pseudomonadales bacterium]MDY6921597.1 OsmC family protein [Pseudomonadota bacterium]
MSDNNQFSISMELVENYLFKIDFGEFGDVMTDEPAPLGNGEGPNPSRLVAAAVGNCLCASLLFALRKQKDEPGRVSATVTGNLERQDGRWRIAQLVVDMQVENPNDLPHLPEALGKFEDFCVVTQSIRQGIPVEVRVRDQQGNELPAAH